MRHCYLDTPLGRLLIAGDDAGLRHVAFTKRQREVPEVGDDWVEDPTALRAAREQLTAYFEGQLQRFELTLAPEGTAFQRRVWDRLRAIPYGATRSYGDIAGELGRKGASRAVGAANGRNPVSIIIPCHRVIGHDGRLTGYGGGLDRKRALLALEANG